VQELGALLRGAGHADLRDARGPLGLTQRQAGGKFTHAEAEALIRQLQDAEHAADIADVADAPRLPVADVALGRVSTERLAAELQRRGWTVTAP